MQANCMKIDRTPVGLRTFPLECFFFFAKEQCPHLFANTIFFFLLKSTIQSKLHENSYTAHCQWKYQQKL